MDQTQQRTRPAVVIWYKVYCVLMALGYALFSLYILFLLWVPKDRITTDETFMKKIVPVLEHMWGGLLGGTIILTAFFIVALFLPRKPWAWIYGIVAICLGLLNCCCLPLSIPLIIVWARPETKQYFGYGETSNEIANSVNRPN